jgi:hypothetical protein
MDDGTGWQLEQGTGRAIVGFSCPGCAAVVGQGLAPVPWHAPHRPLPFPRTTAPFKWSEPVSAVPAALASAWQFVHEPG